MYITLYFIVTCLLDSLRSVRDHFLSLDPTSLTVDLLEQHLLAAETSAVAVGAARGTPRSPFLEGCPPSPLAPSYASAAAADVSVPEDIGAASASAKCRSSKGKGGRGSGGGSGGSGGGSGSGGGGSGSGGEGSNGGGGGGGSGGGSGGSGGGGGGSGGSGGSGGGGTSGGDGGGGEGDGGGDGGDGGGDGAGGNGNDDAVKRDRLRRGYRSPCTGESAALGTSESAALGAGESALCGTAPIAALHTFTLDSGASRSFFRDSTTLTPLSRPVAVSLADPSGGPVLAHSSTVLPSPTAPSGLCRDSTSPQSLRTLRTCLYTLSTASPPVPASGQVAAPGQVFAAASRSSPASLPPLPPGPAPTCVPCAEGWQRSAPHSSEFPPTEAPLQTLHMDVWGPARVNGQGHERYFLLVVDDYSRYTTVFPLRRKGEVTEVLIVWIRGAH
ncbi:unnamed protein product [Closterium sp. NIES-54]